MTAVWRGYITFALISVPVRLFRAARPERVKLRQLYRVPAEDRQAERTSSEKPGPVLASPTQRTRVEPEEVVEEIVAPVRQAPLRQADDQVIPKTALTKGFEYERNRYVTIEPEELNTAAAKTSTEMEIQEFVRLEDIDPIYYESSYYVRPEEAGEKTYALLYESLKETALVAIARFAMHRREHVVAIRAGRSGIIAHTLYFASEVRANEEYRSELPSSARRKWSSLKR